MQTKYNCNTQLPLNGVCYIENVEQAISMQLQLFSQGYRWLMKLDRPDTPQDIRAFQHLILIWNEAGKLKGGIPNIVTADFRNDENYPINVQFGDHFILKPEYRGWEIGLNYGL
jgi:hypothetical protein